MTRLLFGPIFQREMRVIGRHLWPYLWRSLFVLGLLLLLTVASFELLWGASGSGIFAVQRLQQIAPTVAAFTVWFGFLFTALAAPILTAGAIADERTKGTLATLLTTPLTAAQIVGGKLAAKLTQLLVFALLTTPVLLAIRVFGGFDARLILAGLAVTLTTALLGATLGLWYSTRHQRSTIAALFAIMTMVLVTAGPVLTVMLIVSGLTRSAQRRGLPNPLGFGIEEALGVMSTTCSPMALAIATWQATGSRGGGPPTNFTLAGIDVPIYAFNAAYVLVIAAIFFLWTTARVRRVMREAGGNTATKENTPPENASELTPTPADPTEPELSRRVRKRRARSAKIASRPSREIDDPNPIRWRELRQSLFQSKTGLRVVLGILAVTLVLLYWNVPFSEAGLHGVIAIVTLLITLISAIFLTTVAVSAERESRTWDVLLTTPLTPHQIILGKLTGTLNGLRLFPVVLLAHCLLAIVLGAVYWLLPIHLMLIIIPPTLFFAVTGTLASLVFKRSTAAGVANLVIALVVLLGPWLGLAIAGEILNSRDATMRSLESAVYYSSPFAMTVEAINGGTDTNGSHRYSLHPGRNWSSADITPLRFTLTILGIALGWLLLALAALGLTVRSFDRLTGRPRIAHAPPPSAADGI